MSYGEYGTRVYCKLVSSLIVVTVRRPHAQAAARATPRCAFSPFLIHAPRLMPSRRLEASLWDRIDSMSGDFDAAPHLSMHADSSAARVVPPARYSLMNPASVANRLFGAIRARWREVMSERVDRMLLHVPIQPDRLCILHAHSPVHCALYSERFEPRIWCCERPCHDTTSSCPAVLARVTVSMRCIRPGI